MKSTARSVLRRQPALIRIVLDDLVLLDEGNGGKFVPRVGCNGHMSFEYGKPKYSSKPCRVGRNSG
jgi:hypothetical protein